jgi:hypothetical protein
MSTRIAFTWVSMMAVALMAPAQTPPPEVDQALRARVTEFLQYHVDGNFRKAYDMVAEDTKDYYFGMGKVQLQGFKIDDVKFTDNFTKALVTATMSRTVSVAGTDIPTSLPSTITWKIENGKWVWYNEVKAAGLPIGPVSPAPAVAAAPAANNNGGADLPKDFSDQTLTAAARSILQQISVDKKEITLAADKISEDKVVFHNGMPGSVQLELNAPDIPGFTATLGQSMVRASADVPVVFRYDPGDTAAPRAPINVQLMVQPLNQAFVIRVNFAAPGPVVPK